MPERLRRTSLPARPASYATSSMCSLSIPAEEPLYLDFAASTPPAEEVVDAMLPWLRASHANPHSDHWHGHRAAQVVESAREAVADLVGGYPDGVIFTSGATEANNLALKGTLATSSLRRQLWLAEVEHKSLVESARYLATTGVCVQCIAVSELGVIDAAVLRGSLQGSGHAPGVVAVSHGNNEIGTVQSLAELGRVAHAFGHLLHVDASQSAARVPINVEEDECDLVCLSSHKLYGPGGIGALYVAPELLNEVQPLFHGGGQERGRRPGTVPPFLAVGFGTAALLAKRRLAEDREHFTRIVESFLTVLQEPGLRFALIGHPEQRLPGHLSFRLEGVEAEDLLALLAPSLSASTGAACTAGEVRASHVLRALGMSERTASEVIRITFGRQSSVAEAMRAAQLIVAAGRRILARSD